MLLAVDHGAHHAVIDDDQRDLTRYTWRLDRDGYVYRKVHGERIYLHRIILGDAPAGMIRDHINRDKLDNRASNLRFVTTTESAENRSASAKNALGYRGIDLFQGKWRARVQRNGKAIVSRLFACPHEANAFLVEQRRSLMPASHEARGVLKA